MLLAALTLVAAPCALARPQEPAPWWDAAIAEVLARAGDRRGEWEAEALRVEESARSAFAWLVTHMPERDLAELSPAFVGENVRLALRARDEVPWGAALPEDVFLDAVLPYAHVSEPRDPWRAEFLERFLPVVADCDSPGEAAQKLNATIFGELGVRYSTQRKRADQSPKESIEQGLASCTGLSILLADACRAVCVPARLAGIPEWPNKPGNHTWVEVWDDGWHFTGAAEPDGRGLDHAWFQGDAALAVPGDPRHGIYAVSWAERELVFPMVWAPGQRAGAVDVTARYLPERARPAELTRLMVDVLDADGRRVALPVRVRAADGTAHTGTSHGESHDTNDHLTFELPRETRCTLEVAGAGGTWVARDELALDGEDQRILRLAAPSAAELGAARRAAAWAEYAARHEHAARRADFDARIVRTSDRESPYTLREVGQRPAGGWGLVIAMHGGGGAPKEVNDGGWRTMQRYYRDHPEHGGYLYCALRAPNDVWNGFYDDAISPLVEELIAELLLYADVDPDRVVLIGYSHGGYGAFVIGTKIPHRFAAVHSSAAAPTDGETRAENLVATRFSFMVGENDTAYGRRERCERFDALVQELRGERADLYPVTFSFQPGHGHGGLPDRDLLGELMQHRRDPAPRELRWVLTDDRLRDFSWLSVDAPKDGARVSATCRDNRVELTAEGLEHVTVRLDERLVDLARPVTIVANGREQVVQLAPDPAALAESLARSRDPRLAFCAEVELDLSD